VNLVFMVNRDVVEFVSAAFQHTHTVSHIQTHSQTYTLIRSIVVNTLDTKTKTGRQTDTHINKQYRRTHTRHTQTKMIHTKCAVFVTDPRQAVVICW
jgi:hypothetical protein